MSDPFSMVRSVDSPPNSKARPKSAFLETTYHTVCIKRSENGFGFNLSPEGDKIESIDPQSSCASEDVEVGDKVILINGKFCDSKTPAEIFAFLEESKTQCELKIFRPPIIYSPNHRSASLKHEQIKNNIMLYNNAIRKENETQSELFTAMSSFQDTNNPAYLELNEEIKKSRERESECRKKILSFQDSDDNDQPEPNWIGLKSMNDNDSINLTELSQFIIFCLHRSILSKLLFVENVIALQIEKKAMDLAKRIFNTYLNEKMQSEFLLNDIINNYRLIVNTIAAALDKSEQDSRSVFVELKTIISITLAGAYEDFQANLMKERLQNPGLEKPSQEEIFLNDAIFLGLVKPELDANKNQTLGNPTKLSYSIKLLKALLDIVKPCKGNKGRTHILEKLLKDREKLVKKRTERPKSMMVGGITTAISSGVKKWETMKEKYEGKIRGNVNDIGERSTSPLPELTSSNETYSPQIQKKDNKSIHSTDSNEDNDEIFRVIEPSMQDKELIIQDLIAWETQAKADQPEFNIESLSKTERGRQMVIHELINVHHNACIKINFLIKIFKPTILRVSDLKEPQLAKIFRNIEEIKIMFDELKDDLEARQEQQWPVISGVGDILLDHFNLESDKGKNFQHQVATWVSKDADAMKEVKKYQNIKDDILKFQAAIDEGDKHPRLNRLEFSNVLTVIFQIMPRYPMLLRQLLKWTDTEENKDNQNMKEEVVLLGKAKDSIQVTVSETNKRAGEEELKDLLTDIKTHLKIGDFLLAAKTDEVLTKFIDVKSFLEMDKVIKYGVCNITELAIVQPKAQKSTAVTYLLLNDSFVFFTKEQYTEHKTYSIYSSLIPSTSSNQQIFFFFPLESLHIRSDATNNHKLYLIHKSSNCYRILDLGTADSANELLSCVSAQQSVYKQTLRNISSLTQPERFTDGNGEVSEDADDAVFEAPIPVQMPTRIIEAWAGDTLDHVDDIDGKEDEPNSGDNTPLTPLSLRSRRRNGFKRTVVKVKTIPTDDLLAKLTIQINNISNHLNDTDEAQDAFNDLQQIFQRYKNSLTS